MLMDKVGELEEVLFKMRRTNAVLRCLVGCYFMRGNPDELELVTGYRTCQDVLGLVRDTGLEQEESLRRVVNELYERNKGE